MDLEGTVLSEINQRKANSVWDHLNVLVVTLGRSNLGTGYSELQTITHKIKQL